MEENDIAKKTGETIVVMSIMEVESYKYDAEDKEIVENLKKKGHNPMNVHTMQTTANANAILKAWANNANTDWSKSDIRNQFMIVKKAARHYGINIKPTLIFNAKAWKGRR